MIDILIPTRRSCVAVPENLHPGMLGFFRMALRMPELPDAVLLDLIRRTPVIDFTLEILKAATDPRKTPYRLLISEGPDGFIAAVNRQLQESRYDLVLLNDDVFVSPGWLAQLAAAAPGDIRGCKVLYPNGCIQHAGGSITQAGSGIHIGRYHYDLGQFDQPMEVVYNTFACVYIKRAVIDAVGELDPDFGLGYFDDIDYACRARMHGFSSWYHPVPVYHLERTSMDQIDRIKVLYDQNRAIFRQKWVDHPDRFGYLFINARKPDPEAMALLDQDPDLPQTL